MKYQAVIFDLFGTLVPNFSEKEYRRVIRQMASILSAPAEAFLELWLATFHQRILGTLPSLEANVTFICRELGLAPKEDQIQEAVKIRFNYEVASMLPRPDAAEVLSTLKSKDYRIGLITDCSSEAPAIWGNTVLAPYFDISLFSCLIGIKKPDMRIYHMAADRLGTNPGSCLYVGDGSSQELTGAFQAGMHPVHLLIPEEDNPDVRRVDRDNWTGPQIQSLTEVLALID